MNREAYTLYKARGEIEQTSGFLKNLLKQDHTYLQDKYAVESWAFIIHLKYIRRVKVNSSWITGEISGKTQKLLDSLNVYIT